jgi:hypothetical protein
VNDEQMTISGVPTDSGQPGSRSPRSLRAASRPRPMSGNVTPAAHRSPGGSPDSAAASHPARPGALAHDVYDLGVRTDLVTACRIALGIGSTTAYALAGRGDLPFPAYRVGRQWVVPTAGLRTFLGLPQQEPTEAGTS